MRTPSSRGSNNFSGTRGQAFGFSRGKGRGLANRPAFRGKTGRS